MPAVTSDLTLNIPWVLVRAAVIGVVGGAITVAVNVWLDHRGGQP